MTDVAVVLMAYGSPDRLEDVPAYYADIRGRRPIRPELLAELVERYRRLGIEDANPLNAITEETRAALEAELVAPVFTGMKHWSPRIADAAELAIAAGVETIVGLVLAPHYSRMSIAGYRTQLEAAIDGRAELAFVESWHDDPGFVSFLADRIRGTENSGQNDASPPGRAGRMRYKDAESPNSSAIGATEDDVARRSARHGGSRLHFEASPKAHVIFTAHSLPARILDEGDPYEEQLLETSRLVAESAGVTDWSFSYQSESATGEPWLQPDILDHLGALRERGIESVLVCPVGFVSDHLEIRWDIDVEAAGRAQELGMLLGRMPMPNAEPAFIAALAAIVRRATALPSA